MRMREGGKATAEAAFGTMKKSLPAEKEDEWEVRPGGMVVQKRDPDADAAAAFAAPVPTVRVKVKYGAVYHEIHTSSQSTFGELKKVLSTRTGLHPLDMKLIYKDKERDSMAFLDTAGVKDKSKVVLVEDPTAQAKRLLEMRRTDKMEKAAKSISAVSLDVDRLTSKVAALDEIVSKGGTVVENDVTNLIELLMNELIKLDAIVADGDVQQHRRMQIKRVQKYVESLDVIKIKNAKPIANGDLSKEPPQSPQAKNDQPQHRQQIPQNNKTLQRPQHPNINPRYQQQMHRMRDLQQPLNSYEQINHHQPPRLTQKPVVVTTNWETFDSLSMPSTSAATSTATVTAAATASAPYARFDWELF